MEGLRASGDNGTRAPAPDTEAPSPVPEVTPGIVDGEAESRSV